MRGKESILRHFSNEYTLPLAGVATSQLALSSILGAVSIDRVVEQV